MKTMYIRIVANTRAGYDIDKAIVYKEYKEYGIAITRYPAYTHYYLTDIETGLSASKSFRKLKDAKSFMDHTEEVNFIDWYKAVEKARTTPRYESLKIKVC